MLLVDFNLTGLGRGGQQVLRSKEVYAKAVETLVELASLQTAFICAVKSSAKLHLLEGVPDVPEHHRN